MLQEYFGNMQPCKSTSETRHVAPVFASFRRLPALARQLQRMLKAGLPAWSSRGFILCPGKPTRVGTFRVGCIGAIDSKAVFPAVAAIGATMAEPGASRLSAGQAASGVRRANLQGTRRRMLDNSRRWHHGAEARAGIRRAGAAVDTA